MAYWDHKVAASDGSTANPAQVQGGTFLDGGSTTASAAITNTLAPGLTGAARAALAGGTRPTENVNAIKPRAAGTWDYQVAGSYIVRRMATTINGTADTTLQSGGSDFRRHSIHVRSNQIGAKTGTAIRAGYWRPNGVGKYGLATAQRTNWSTAPAAASANYANNVGALSATSDDAARPTRAIPGELVYLQSHVTWTDNMIDYASRA